MPNLPKYTKNKMKGNIGEALAQYLLSNFCLVHKIDGSSDIGNDFICELIKDEYPTNLLFYVQVKYSRAKPHIKRETLEYWRGSPIPIYLFWVKPITKILNYQDLNKSKKFYKRYTPIVHGHAKEAIESFYEYKELKFKRHLIIDYARSQYIKGFTPLVEPRDFLNIDEKVLMGLDRYLLFVKDVIPKYSEKILSQSWVNLLVIAVLLKNKGGKENLHKARLALDLAEKLLEKDKERYTKFRSLISKHRQEIEEIIEK